MSNLHKIGALGEEAAADFLQNQGYSILERSFSTKHGEIDLIAEDHGTVVFIEVKTRKSLASGAPEEAVDRDKRRKIRRAADWYLQPWSRWPPRTRFDVVGIELDESDRVIDIRHTPGAFEAE